MPCGRLTSGSGKTTLTGRVALLLNAAPVEIDRLAEWQYESVRAQLAARPRRNAAVVLGEAEVERLEREIVPYAEALHRTMLKHTTEEPLY